MLKSYLEIGNGSMLDSNMTSFPIRMEAGIGDRNRMEEKLTQMETSKLL